MFQISAMFQLRHCQLLSLNLINQKLINSIHTFKLNLNKLKIYENLFESKYSIELKQIQNSMYLIPNFITDNEEQLLLNEVENIFNTRRIRYEQTHWDDAIQNYRETEHLQWQQDINKKIIERIRNVAFNENTNHIKYVHILEIKSDGFIKPHVDSVRFCGNTIAGLSLLSDSVMRMRLETNRDIYVDILLNRRSLYIMTNEARYLYAHEILDDENSYFNGKHLPRKRRISIICRNEPSDNNVNN